MVPIDKLQKYFQRVTGMSLVLTPAPADKISRIPNFLTLAWTFFDTQLMEDSFVFAVETDPNPSMTPARFAQQTNMLREIFGREVVLIMSHLPSTSVSRLMERQVPFIVVGGDIFIPCGLMLLRKRKPAPLTQAPATLSAPAQLLILMRLLGRPVENVPLANLASLTGYTPMTLSNVAREIQAAGLAEILRRGRAATIRFTHAGLELWDSSQDRLASPVSRKFFARFSDGQPKSLLRAGISALSELSMLSDDAVPTYAIFKRDVTKLIDSGAITALPDSDDADALVEVWNYDPAMLGQRGLVDSLSLRLSLRDCPDERVEKELDAVMRDFQW